MSWHGIHGHDEVAAMFRRALARGRLASTYLFVGPEGVGKRSFALKLAQALLCQSPGGARLDPCGHCTGCIQLVAGTHPDLLRVAKPPEKSTVPLELLIGSDDRRMKEGLCHDISLKPLMGGRRIAIIDDADFLNEEGANSLLKTLEEPPPRSVLILIGTSPDRQLPTIRSRAQIVRFQPLAASALADLLLAHGVVQEAALAARLAAHSEGSLARARELADPALWEFRRQLLQRLAQPRLESVRLAKTIGAFVDEAGKEAPPRRARARQVVGMTIEFYRQLARALSDAPAADDPELRKSVEQVLSQGRVDAETAAACAERSLEALGNIDRFANQGAWLECWMDDLAAITHRAM